MTQTAQAYTTINDIKENPFNLSYTVGDSVSFVLDNPEKQLNGTILKKYTNSCLIDISDNSLSLDEKRTYQGKIVISYKSLEAVS